MLQRLRVKNFKLLRDVDVELSKKAPTVLIGPNASGKSTVIEVLDFLSRCASDGLQRAVTAHGGMAAIRTIGTRNPIEISVSLTFRTTAELGDKDWDLTWTVVFGTSPAGQVQIQSETLMDGERKLLETAQDGGRLLYNELALDEAPTTIPDSQALVFETHADPQRYKGLGLVEVLLTEIRVLGALSSIPSWAAASTERASARDAVVISTESFVGREGVGLATALYNLQTEHADAWATLERAFRAEFPFVKRIVFPPDPGGSRISFAIEDERFSARRVFASEMSDGMIVFLCLLSLVLHPNQQAVLALDEPDAHLHPSALRRLLALAQEPHQHRHLLIVTHSNALLDELRDPVASIRVVEVTPQGARIRKLDAESLTAWRTEYSLSELRQTGLLDPSNTSYDKDGNDE
ncbi:MAG TPA: AAA family ATPase [Kofleriaceae bacterium]|nr:AAA family ATPase [Kofleriaceae bacterium]